MALIVQSSFYGLKCEILVRLVLKFLQTFKGSFRAQMMPITRSKQLVVVSSGDPLTLSSVSLVREVRGNGINTFLQCQPNVDSLLSSTVGNTSWSSGERVIMGKNLLLR